LRRFAFALVLVALVALPSLALDRNALAFTQYDLRVTLDPHQHGLSAEGAVELRNASAQSQSEAILQISSSLQWLSVRAANGDAVEWLTQSYTSDIDHTGSLSEAIVKLGHPLAPGQSVRFQVRYAGTVQPDTTRLERIGTPAEAALRSDWDQIGDNCTALRGAGFVVWYPVSIDAANLAEGNQLFEALRDWRERESSSLLRVHLSRVPLPADDATKFLFVTNATPESSSEPRHESASDSKDSPTKSSLPSPAQSGESLTANFRGVDPVFVLLTEPASSTDRPQVDAYYTAAHTGFARDYIVAAEAVIPHLEPWFGKPQRKVVIVELTNPDALPYDAGPFYFVPMFDAKHFGVEVALTRPVVHAMIDSPRPWIREGLATFGQALIRERQSGRDAAINYLGQFRSALSVAQAQSHSTLAPGESSSSQPPSIGLQPLVTTADELFFRTKAAYVWWMLRDMVGDQTLQAALAHYRPADDRDTGYMQRLIEQRLTPKRDLEPFFDDWVYRDRGLPQLHAESAFMRKTLPDQTVTAVTVENLGEAWCEVPVTVRSASAESTLRLVIPAKSKATVRVPLDDPPTEALVNDGSVPEADLHDNVVPVTSTIPPEH
jgi:hypothetical protein